MADYESTSKIDWVIEKMGSWISRQEILRLAEIEFPKIPWKTLEGTIGQYWTDSPHPIYGNAFRRRGLRAEEMGTERRLVRK